MFIKPRRTGVFVQCHINMFKLLKAKVRNTFNILSTEFSTINVTSISGECIASISYNMGECNTPIEQAKFA